MNKQPCRGCQSVSYYFTRTAFTKDGVFEECSDCTSAGTPNLSPDVYFDGRKGAFQTDPNLCHRDGSPIPFSSKREKAAVMRQLGVREAGDKERGSRNFDRSAAKQWDGVNKI